MSIVQSVQQDYFCLFVFLLFCFVFVGFCFCLCVELMKWMIYESGMNEKGEGG